MSETLPPVAKSIFTFCKKCDADRYHVVLAHKTATSASIQCEVCKKKGTYSVKKTSSAGKSRPLAGAAAKARANSESSRRNAHASQYETLMAQYSDKELINYTMKGSFEMNQKLSHPKFGVGIITLANNEKIEVAFADEVKSLIHKRS